MRKIEDKNIAYFDVDDTLVLWPIGGQPDPGKEDEYLYIDDVMVRPHKAHIQAMKEHKARGHIVVVWSQGGSDWAEAVVMMLKLEKYVDIIMPKPTWYYDDLPSSVFMPESCRFYKDID